MVELGLKQPMFDAIGDRQLQLRGTIQTLVLSGDEFLVGFLLEGKMECQTGGSSQPHHHKHQVPEPILVCAGDLLIVVTPGQQAHRDVGQYLINI